MAENAMPLGLAGLVVAASLVEALRKRSAIDREAVDDLVKTALIYVQAFCVDHPVEIEQETKRILQVVAKASGQPFSKNLSRGAERRCDATHFVAIRPTTRGLILRCRTI